MDPTDVLNPNNACLAEILMWTINRALQAHTEINPVTQAAIRSMRVVVATDVEGRFQMFWGCDNAGNGLTAL